MAKTIKETLLGTLVHGQEVLDQIEVLRTLSADKIPEAKGIRRQVGKLHRDALKLRVNEILETGKEAKRFRLSTVDGYLPPFEAGQYLNLFTEIDGVRTSRPYSISSSPKQKSYYEITVARTQNGFVSDYLLDEVKVGDIFEANGPAGVFRYHPVFHGSKSLYLAGGSGITPFMSMLSEILEADLERDVVMLYGCRNEGAALFHEELTAYAQKHPRFRYHLVLSEAKEGWKGASGFLSAELIQRLVPDYLERTSYICGPQVMNEFCLSELSSLGLPPKRLRREMFGATAGIEKEAGWPAGLNPETEFTMQVEGRRIQVKAGESLLVALEKAGIRVNVCCRSGECSLCRVKLLSGKVYLAKGMLLRKADEQYGYVHACKSYPISDLSIAF